MLRNITLSADDFLIQNMGYDPHRLTVVLNGVDTQLFKFDPNKRNTIRKEFGMGPNEVLVGGVGRLHDQKGFDILIEAISHLQKMETPTRLLIVGEGPRRRALERLA